MVRLLRLMIMMMMMMMRVDVDDDDDDDDDDDGDHSLRQRVMLGRNELSLPFLLMSRQTNCKNLRVVFAHEAAAASSGATGTGLLVAKRRPKAMTATRPVQD
ncbi:hypothetical protein EYF80_007119 [Liparis tanakae]|uniref:Secreted protein n=1 Tax=Liparis tanakae TaxID=230148 RepID=A0A4Z2IXW7_9TELE|nr:hypothetical protein EYF80_007119 [Liparis tanakae]